MARTKDLKRRLDALCETIEALDADLSSGRVGPDEHGRRRGALEREAGELFVRLRRAQRERAEREAESAPPATRPVARAEETPVPSPGWASSPAAWVVGGVILLVVGVGAGVVVGRGVIARPPAPVTAVAPGGTSPVPADAPSSQVTETELRALRDLAAREDAPTAGLLQFAHVALDQGKTDEARRAYERVLAREPKNVEAITHVGAVLYQEGRVDEALAKVGEALRIDPRYVHALWDRTQYLFQAKRDYAAAAKAAEAFLKVVPDGPDADNVKKLLAEARRQMSSASGPAKTR